MADKKKEDITKLPAYLGGGAPALGYFPDFMPGQQAALAQQLSAGYQQPVSKLVPDGLVTDKLGGSVADYMKYLDNMYTPMGSAIPKPVAAAAPVVAPKPVVKPVVKPVSPVTKTPAGLNHGRAFETNSYDFYRTHAPGGMDPDLYARSNVSKRRGRNW